jgi:hypothetical protein
VEERNKVSRREADLIEQKTRGQSKNVQWKEERAWRITASKYVYQKRSPALHFAVWDVIQQAKKEQIFESPID